MLGWEESMATNSSVLAWRIPWKEEPGGSRRIGHDWNNWAYDPIWINLEDAVPGDCLEFRITGLWKNVQKEKGSVVRDICLPERPSGGMCKEGNSFLHRRNLWSTSEVLRSMDWIIDKYYSALYRVLHGSPGWSRMSCTIWLWTLTLPLLACWFLRASASSSQLIWRLGLSRG